MAKLVCSRKCRWVTSNDINLTPLPLSTKYFPDGRGMFSSSSESSEEKEEEARPHGCMAGRPSTRLIYGQVRPQAERQQQRRKEGHYRNYVSTAMKKSCRVRGGESSSNVWSQGSGSSVVVQGRGSVQCNQAKRSK
jgi:hypothetical protein